MCVFVSVCVCMVWIVLLTNTMVLYAGYKDCFDSDVSALDTCYACLSPATHTAFDLGLHILNA